MSAGDRIVELRHAAGLSQAQVADAMTKMGFEGIYPQTILKIEKGRRGLKFAEGIVLAHVLGVDPVALLSDVKP